MARVGSAGKPALLEDRRTWRLLLAKLHPDAGGDLELFAFACALREEMRSEERSEGKTAPHHRGRRTEPFLRTWRDAMGCWAVRNRDDLKNP